MADGDAWRRHNAWRRIGEAGCTRRQRRERGDAFCTETVVIWKAVFVGAGRLCCPPAHRLPQPETTAGSSGYRPSQPHAAAVQPLYLAGLNSRPTCRLATVRPPLVTTVTNNNRSAELGLVPPPDMAPHKEHDAYISIPSQNGPLVL